MTQLKAAPPTPHREPSPLRPRGASPRLAVPGVAGKPPRLGDVLVRGGVITPQQLEHALAQQREHRLPLGQLLLKLGYLTDEAMRQALALQLSVSYIDLDRLTVDKSLIRLVNSNYAKRHGLIPVALVAQTLTVCMDDPTSASKIEDLARSTGLTITVVTASHDAIERAYARLYDVKTHADATDVVDLVLGEPSEESGKSRYVDEYRRTKQADALLRRLLSIAIAKRASDIHLETLEGRMQVRFRIDGMLEGLNLRDVQETCDHNSREIVSRIKVLAKLDISERRRPQDGGFRLRIDGVKTSAHVDLRVSVVPSYYGECVVLRLLDRKHAPTSLEQLQFPTAVADRLRQLLQRPSGILLVTGPTGSGKSTTLYASLMTLYRPQIRVLTAEDPIEYVYDQFSQSEVNADIGNTFASYLRAFLRHDPEVIMVGEIRDEETARMAFRAAQTGHLLLSTLHTESAIASVGRLLDLGIDRNSLSSTMIGVLGQRLVRQVCTACETTYQPAPDLLREFFPHGRGGMVFKKGAGCQACNYSGYRGRVTIVELWVPDAEDALLLTKGADADALRASAARTTFSMADSISARLREGRTNLEELIRVIPYAAIKEFRQQQSIENRAASA